jgi:uncharacterized damage-inducible protein DinB
MAIADALLPEFDHEVATTRKLLERVPDDKFDWKPHERSMSLGQLASHVATLPGWGSMTMGQSEFDLATGPPPVAAKNNQELVATFDRITAETRAAIAGKPDAEFMAPWSLKHTGKTIFTMPKAAVMRSFVLNHLIHHRGQLSVYLRLNDVPLPSIYGPSADERPNF